MGDNFLKEQIKYFEKGRDRAARNMREPTLYSRPEVYEAVYTAESKGDCRVQKGERLYVATGKKDNCVTVIRGHVPVGSANGEVGKALSGVLNDIDGSGVADIEVTSYSELSKTFQFRISKNEDG